MAEEQRVQKLRAAALTGLVLPLWFSASAVAGAATAPAGLLPVPPAPVVALLPSPVASLLGVGSSPSPSAAPTSAPSATASPSASATSSPSADPLGLVLTLLTGTTATPAAPTAPVPSSGPTLGPASINPVTVGVSDSSTGLTGHTPLRAPDVSAFVNTQVQRIGKAVVPRSGAARKHHVHIKAAPAPAGLGVLPASVGSVAGLFVAAPQLAGEVSAATLPNTDTPATVLATQSVHIAEVRARTTAQVSTGLSAVAFAAVCAAAAAQVPARRRLNRR